MLNKLRNSQKLGIVGTLLVFAVLNMLFTHESRAQSRAPRDRQVTTTSKIPKEQAQEHQAPIATRLPPPSHTSDTPCIEVYIEPILAAVQETIVEPMRPAFVPIEEVAWSLWYVGAQLGGIWPQGEVAQEYQQGSSFAGVAGLILENGVGFEVQLQRGNFAGVPQFDYLTTTHYPDGSIAYVMETPDRMMAASTSLGLKATYQWLKREAGSHISSGWRVGASLRYVWFSEEASLTQEVYSSETGVSRRGHNVENFFQRPVFGLEVSSSTAVASSWWIDLTAGYDFASNAPQRALPTVFDWNQYTGQFSVGVALKISMGALPSRFLI